jgi:subtilisin family serine protease
MRKTFIVTICYIFVFYMAYSSEKYRWYKGEKIAYDSYEYKKFIVFDSGIDYYKLVEIISHEWQVLNFYTNENNFSFIKLKEESFYKEFNYAIIQSKTRNKEFELFKGIEYISDFLIEHDNKDTIGISNYFNVKLWHKSDFEILEKISNEYNVDIIGQDPLMPLWFMLKVNLKSKGNDALDIANKFHELEYFQYSSPEFILENFSHCVNDAFFNSQWNLSNIGQYGGNEAFDISICNAWGISTGSANIRVAVLDQGIQLNHPDLPNVTQSFDTHNNQSPSVIRGSHGVACAGIIAASSSNNIGIAGIAPNVQLMSISNNLQGVDFATKQSLALGLNWAWQNGADVISNSWGHNSLSDPIIDDAITNALTQGRAGLGSVIVFSSGNSNTNVAYPANSNPLILAVGATSMCEERKSLSSCDGELWGSNFGDELDIVAPGVLISTTDLQGNDGYNPTLPIHLNNGGSLVLNDFANEDYTIWFNGTSAAAPHVSGVAALILSVNPCLTVEEVNDIIERSARKLPSYTYSTIGGRPNGTWNNETGYGMLNAEAALQAVLNQWLLQNNTETGNLLVASHTEIKAGQNVNLDPNIGIGPYIIASGADVEFKATQSITLEAGFTALAGSNFLAHIETFNGNCNQWNSKNLWVEAMEDLNSDDFFTIEDIPSLKTNRNFNPLFFPNPFNESLYIKYDLEKDEIVTIQLFDLSGREVFNKVFNGHSGQNMHFIDVQTNVKMLISKTCISGECKTSKLVKIGE